MEPKKELKLTPEGRQFIHDQMKEIEDRISELVTYKPLYRMAAWAVVQKRLGEIMKEAQDYTEPIE